MCTCHSYYHCVLITVVTQDHVYGGGFAGSEKRARREIVTTSSKYSMYGDWVVVCLDSN